MAGSLIAYMRAHGNTPGPTQRPLLAGLQASLLAETPAALLLWKTGAIASVGQAIGITPVVALALHAGAMAAAGAAYGRLFGRAANDRRGGWLFGISYGYLLWMLGPVGLMQWVLGAPLAVGTAAIGLMLAQLLHGLVMGTVFPGVHRRISRSSWLKARKEPVGRSSS